MDYKVDEKMNDLSNEVDNSIQLKLDEIESKLIELNENLNFSSADGALNYAEETFRSRRKTKLESICKDIQNIDLYLRIHGHQEKHSRQRKKIEDLRKELSQKLGRITTGKTVLGLVPYFNKVSSVINNLKGSNDE